MSQFDFPRINFFGKTSVNVATCNNDDFKPMYTANGSGLMVHDIVNTGTYLPPRVYVTAAVMAITPGYTYVSAGNSLGTDYYYVEIAGVNLPEVFYEWAQVPLGKSKIDTQYYGLYTAAQLTGNIPAEWNYNGGMQFVIHDCSIVSVAVMPTDNTGDNLYTAANPGSCPADLKTFLGASFNAVNDGGANTTTVCDMNPATPFTTQYFTQGFYLRQKGSNATLMAGAPAKGVTRWINFGRVVNIQGSPMIASGAVFQAIPAAAMTEWSQLQAVFEQYGDSSRTLIGALVRYDMFEVYEDRSPDYTQLPDYGTNPAYMSVMGSITPWYEGEMATASIGRVLNPSGPALVSPNIGPQQLAPITFMVDTDKSILSLDVFNTLPENRDPSAEFNPYTNGNNPPPMSYELYDLGELQVQVAGTTLVSFNVTGTDAGINRQTLINNGGMLDFVYTGGPSASIVASSDFSINQINSKGVSATIMAESPYVIQSDQSVGYANQGDPGGSVLSQGITAGPVLLRVMLRGVPVPQSEAASVTQTLYGMDCTFNLLQLSQGPISVYDGMAITADTSTANLLLFVFTPPGTNLPTPTTFSGATEFYLNLRVLPNQSAQFAPYYLQPDQSGYLELTWDVLYQEIFKSYEMLYPAMTQQMPFNDGASWSEPFVASRLMQVINQNMWNQPWYMPRSRDLSNAQRTLINTWATAIIKNANA